MLIRTVVAGFYLAGLLAAADTRVADMAMQGDRDAVQSLLKLRADVNAAQGDGMTALHWAASKDDLELIKMLLDAGANVKAETRLGGRTPLSLACTNGDAAIVEALLKAGADPNAANTLNGETSLMAAAASGSAEAVKVLLDHGASVNAKETAHGQTALMFAAAVNRAAVVRLLAAHGADLNASTQVEKIAKQQRYDDNGNPIPDRKTPEPKPGEKPRSGVPNVSRAATVMGGMSALLFAARDGQLEAVKALVETGADINQVSGSEKTSPLVMAISNGHYEVGKYLLDKGADPNLANIYGLAPLYATIDMQYAPLGWAPVPVVAQEKVNYLDLMRDLLDHGADPNVKLTQKLWFRPTSHDKAWVNPQGSTAFWRAAASSDVAAMKLLMEKGANPNLTSDQGDLPLMVAAGVGWGPGNFSQNSPVPGAWLNAVKLCLELGQDINQQDDQGYTALHGAAFRGDNEMVQYLVQHGARMDIKSKKGYTATDMANGIDVVFGLPLEHPETVALLEKLGGPAPDNSLTVAAGKPKAASGRNK